MRKTVIKIVIIAFSVILLLGAAGYLWYAKLRFQQSDTSYTTVKKHLSQFMHIPEDNPVIVEVSDAESLKKQDSFYKEAQKNDLIIVWKEKAIIYRPSTQQVVDWGVIIK